MAACFTINIRFFMSAIVLLNLLTLYLMEIPFNTFATRADPDQAALLRAA